MDTKGIISWLRDKAARAGDHSWQRMMEKAASVLESQQKRIAELEEQERWIPVTEQLPHKEVLAISMSPGHAYKERLVGWIALDDSSKTGFICVDDGAILYDVTHWKDPVPPKEGAG